MSTQSSSSEPLPVASSGVSSLPELEVHTGYWLRRVSNQVSGAFARALQARQVSVAEWVALQHIRSSRGTEEYITPGDLAERLGMTRGAISKVIDKLEAKGWTVRTTNPEDNRVHWLSLTPEGKLVLPELTQIADSNDEKFFGCLSSEEMATLRELLQKLTRVHEWNAEPID